jgi:hypothetical protein
MNSDGWESIGVLIVMAVGEAFLVRAAFYVGNAFGWAIGGMACFGLAAAFVALRAVNPRWTTGKDH